MPDDRTAVLVSSARTPVGRYGGAFKAVPAVELGAAAVASALSAAGDPRADHVYLGNVVQAGNGQNPARGAAYRAGMDTTIPATTLNDVCLASMSAVGIAASLIRADELDTAVVGGFDSMSRALHGVLLRQPTKFGDAPMIDLLSRDGLWCSALDEGMGPISERENARLGIERWEQDELSFASHARAWASTEDGRLAEETFSFAGLDHDEGIRRDTTLERLGELRPAFAENGTITAGNASPMSDAAAAGVLMSAGAARALGVVPLVEVVGRSVVAGPDFTLHLKPAAAAAVLMERHGLSARDIGRWEINEAFAGVVVASMRELGIDFGSVNVNGGAIAIGHPLAASGFRIVSTLAHEMRRSGTEWGIATMCGGGGQGESILLRLPGE